MVPLLVFYIHVAALAAVFTRRWQEEGWSGGILAVFFMAIIFFAGWAMASFVLRLVMAQEGAGPFFDRDAASLALLTVAEGIFYYFFLRSWSPPSSEDDDS